MRSLSSVLAFVLIASGSNALEYRVGTLDIIHPWSRATPRGSTVGAGYMAIRNGGTAQDRLIGGSSDVAAKLEIHETTITDGVAKMRPVSGGLLIKPGETVQLKPGALHVMFVGLKNPLNPGDHINATLIFEKAGAVNIDFDVVAMGSTPKN